MRGNIFKWTQHAVGGNIRSEIICILTGLNAIVLRNKYDYR